MNDVTNRKLFRKARPARNKLNAMGGIMASSPELMQTVQKFADGSGPQGVQAQPSLASQQRLQDRRFMGNLMYPVAEATDLLVNMPAAGIQNLIKDFQYGTPGRILGLSDYGDQPPADVTGRPARQAVVDYMNTESGPLQSTGVFRDVEAPDGIFSPAMADEAPAEEAPAPTEEPAETTPTQTMPTAPQTEEELEADDRDVAAAAVTDAAAAVQSNLPRETQGAIIADTVKNIVNMQGLSAKEINEQVLEITGAKDPDKDMSREERMKKNIELYKSLFKEDPKDIKTENGFNLAFMGFAIAAGKDPSALANIAEGAKQGLEKFEKSSKARKQRERDAKVFGLTQTLKEEDDIRKQRQRMMELKFGANVDLIKQRFATEADMAKWAATQTIAERQLTRKLDASVKELGLRLDAADRQNIISNLPEASVYWLQANPDATAEDLSNPEVVDEIANLAIKMSPGSRGKTPDPGKTRPAYIQEGVAKATEDPGTRFNIAQALGKPVEQLTTQDIQNYYGNVWDSSSGQPASTGTTINLEPDEG